MPLTIVLQQIHLAVSFVLRRPVAEVRTKGRLVSVLERWLPPYGGFYIYYPSRFQVPPKLRVFVDFLRERLT